MCSRRSSAPRRAHRKPAADASPRSSARAYDRPAGVETLHRAGKDVGMLKPSVRRVKELYDALLGSGAPLMTFPEGRRTAPCGRPRTAYAVRDAARAAMAQRAG